MPDDRTIGQQRSEVRIAEIFRVSNDLPPSPHANANTASAPSNESRLGIMVSTANRWSGLILASVFWLWLAAFRFGVSDLKAGAIRLGYFPNITHGQALYGRAEGTFEKVIKAPIQWTSFNAGPAAVESMFIDAIDAAYLGPGPTINGYLKSRGEKFVVVSGAASGGAGLVVREGSGVETDRDFAGKTLATPQIGNTQDIAARHWLAEKGYRLKEKGGSVSIVALSNPDQLTLFRKAQIDAAWTIEPWLSRLELEAHGRLLVDERSLWPSGRHVVTHLVFTRKFLASQPDLARRLLEAHFEITEQINPDKAAAGAIINRQLSRETGKALTNTVLRRALERVEFTCDPLCPTLRKSAEDARNLSFLRGTNTLDGLYSLDLLNALFRAKNLPAVRD